MKYDDLYARVDSIVQDCVENERRPTTEEMFALAGYADQSQANREEPFWLWLQDVTRKNGPIAQQGMEVQMKAALLSIAAGLTSPTGATP